MRVVPISYNNQKKEMLNHTKTMCEIEGMVCVNKQKFPELFLDLQTARRHNKVLVKDKDTPQDLFEAFMQSLWYFDFDS